MIARKPLVDKFSKCIICEKKIKIEKNWPTPRDTCPKVRINDVMVKSACEKERDKRYQEGYRKRMKENLREKRKAKLAESSAFHLTFNRKLKKHNRVCLKCDEKFIGIGPYNRICPICTLVNQGLKD